MKEGDIIFEEIMTKIYYNLKKDANSQILEAHCVRHEPNQTKPNTTYSPLVPANIE